MARLFRRLFWPSADFSGITTVQRTQAGVPVEFNGNLIDPYTGVANFLDKGFIRTVAITAQTGNETVIVNGTQNGVSISEEVDTEAGSVVQTIEAFDYVTSVVPQYTSNLDNEIIVGSGTAGFLPLIKLDTSTLQSAISYGLHIQNLSGECTCAVAGTYDDIDHNGRTFVRIGDAGEFYQIAGNVAGSIILPNVDIPLPNLLKYMLLAIDSGNEDQPEVTAFVMQL